LCMEF